MDVKTFIISIKTVKTRKYFKPVKKLNKNVVCKVIRPIWKTINKTILYVTVWSRFNWNVYAIVQSMQKTPDIANTELNLSMN